MEAVGLLERHQPTSQVADEQPPLDIAVPTPAFASRRPPRASQPAVSAPQPEVEPSEAMSMVVDFHRAFRLHRQHRPTAPLPARLAELRVDLLVEEVNEFIAASRTQDIVGLADALGDIVYVAYGSAVTYGIDLDAVLREVHRSNMSKLDDHGRPIYRADGKVLKSHRYSPPDIAGVLGVQTPLPF